MNLNIDPNQYSVEINPNKQLARACYSERSILQLGGFGSKFIVQRTPEQQTFKFMKFNPN